MTVCHSDAFPVSQIILPFAESTLPIQRGRKQPAKIKQASICASSTNCSISCDNPQIRRLRFSTMSSLSAHYTNLRLYFRRTL